MTHPTREGESLPLDWKLTTTLRKTVASRLLVRASPFQNRWEQMLKGNARCPRLASRLELYSYLNRTYLDGGAAAIDLFEFGVYRGDSLRTWCMLNTNPHSRFYGFDSFEGLPEYWKPGRPKGAFSTFGETPEIKDPRVQIVVGLFQQSLPAFLSSYRPARRIVVNNDSDLYSSTLYSLTRLNSVMPAGTLIIFDEFDDILNEFRALCDYGDAYMREYKIVGATPWFTQTAVELL
jgi:hypothetical protein